ncbi:MAG: hypothetical protein QOG56_2622, partial [Solirubrobacteraceae bacterium]|nr:hypothetical protein [Solirubrobacteraceae bacterium]
MTACARSGCTGAIADGFCDLCGLASFDEDAPARDGGAAQQAQPATVGRT